MSRAPGIVAILSRMDRSPPEAAHVDIFLWYVGGSTATPFQFCQTCYCILPIVGDGGGWRPTSGQCCRV